jgi:DNA-binding response OmpR family regulator
MFTVLTIDDDLQLRTLMAILLTKLGCVSLGARNGIEGQTMTLETRPDLILVDIMMDDQDGYITCEKLRAQGYNGHILLVSAKSLDIDLFVRSGANGYVQKPLTLAILRNHLNSIQQQISSVQM